MASKKIEFILDVNKKPIDVAIDSTLNLKQQFRELTKEINKTKEGTKEFELLSTKLGDVKDQIDTTTAKSRDLFGSLSMLPGPVGAFAGSVDGAVSTLKTFTSFSFKDLKFQLKETLNDFKDIAGNISKATGITKIYTALNNALAKSFVSVGVGEAAAATGARAFAAALTATGIGALVVGLGMAVSALMEYASAADTAAEKQKEFNEAQDRMSKETLDVETQAIKRLNDLDMARAKAKGASANEIYRIEKQGLELQLLAQQRYLRDLSDQNSEEGRKTVQQIKNTQTSIQVLELNFQGQQLKDQQAKNEKIAAANKQHQEKIKQDTKSADDILLNLQRENGVLALEDERKRQDKELQNQKLAEEDKIKSLLISEEKKKEILDQINLKYESKQKEINKKRGEEDMKSAQEWAAKLEDIRIASIQNQQEKEKAELKKGYDNTKADLDKALEEKKISQEQYDQAILNLKQTLTNSIKKIDDDNIKKEEDDRLRKLDAELKFLQIKGETLRQGTKEFYDNQRAILKASEERELADTTLTEEQKTLIKQKYVDQRKKLSEQEFASNVQLVTQTLDSVAKLTSAIASSYDEEAKTSKKAFEKRKKLQIATALMSAASGLIQILTQPSTLPSPFDWITKGINAAALAVSTGVQIAKIKKTQFEGGGGDGGGETSAQNLGKNYSDGGMIGGRRHAQGGTMIEAEQGEAIMTRGAVTMFKPLLSMMNQMGGGTSFTPNLMTTRTDNPVIQDVSQQQQPPIFKTYVVEQELTNAQQRQARLKDLSTL